MKTLDCKRHLDKITLFLKLIFMTFCTWNTLISTGWLQTWVSVTWNPASLVSNPSHSGLNMMLILCGCWNQLRANEQTANYAHRLKPLRSQIPGQFPVSESHDFHRVIKIVAWMWWRTCRSTLADNIFASLIFSNKTLRRCLWGSVSLSECAALLFVSFLSWRTIPLNFCHNFLIKAATKMHIGYDLSIY